MLLNASVVNSFQSRLFCAFVLAFDKSGLRGSDISTRFGRNFIRWWIHPINHRNCFSVLGASSCIMASHLCSVGVTLFGVTLKPSHVISYFANLHFCKFIAKFSFFGSFIFCLFHFHAIEDYLLSSRYANFVDIFWNVLSIVFGNVAG